MSTLALLLVSASLAQETPGPRIEITGVNPGGLPRVGVMINAFDNLGQPLPNLTAEDFHVTGELAPHARVSSVVSFSDPEAVPISAMLVIDVSTSMAGEPIEKAKEAAAAFVNSMAADDPVAVLTFSSRVNLIQGFTTNREELLAIIDSLAYGGQTLLYDATLQAIAITAAIDNPRRAIILLSDGVHYDDQDRSRVNRAQANLTAVVEGVPVYTIGLGYGADRTYLEQISTDTNAFFSESPSPQELNDIYTGLADLLRTQYDITLDVDVPLDGRVWQLELEVDTPWGAVRSSGRLRAPVPVPVFNFAPIDQPVSEPLEIMPDIVADDGIASVAVAMDDERPETVAGPPFTVLVDPVTLSPGDHSLTFSATDRDGDSGSATLEFSVAALPPEVRLEPEPGGELAEAQTYTLEVGGQTPLDSANWRLDDGSAHPLDAALEFTIDPHTLEPGEHRLQLEVTNTGGVTSRPDYFFTVPPLPIRFEIEGLEEGDLLEDSAEIGVSVLSSQFPVTDVEYTLNDVPLPDVDDRISLHAAELVPGAARLDVLVRNAGGQVETDSLEFEVARLPIRFEIEGLEEGDLLEGSAEIGVSVLSSQYPVTDAEYTLNDVPLPDADDRISLHAAELVPGAARLDVLVRNAGGQVETDSLEFEVAGLPLEIDLADLPPGASIDRDLELGVAVSGQGSDFELEVLLDGEPLVLTEASIPLEILQLAPGQHNLVIRARDEFGNVGEESFNFSVSPGPAQTATQALAYRQATEASIQRRATSAARSTQVSSQNRARASATVAARATSTQAATLQMATAAAEATVFARSTGTQAAIEGHATASARSTAFVQRNRERIATMMAARSTSTQVAAEQQATAVARATATRIAVEQRATLDAESTAVALATGTQVVVERQATAAARSTSFAQRNRERITALLAARATFTQVAGEQRATREAEATATQVATQRIATATSAAASTATQETFERIATATTAAEATSTQVAMATATSAAGATATQAATQRIATATRAAEATATRIATQRIATATRAAEATATRIATQRIATAT
ncbi:MAG: VWA domain-containing protein, partial [Anaerolineaceae bacterium]|nr:VWA domain-containing protein [Anaerolineaceae bacterium]